LIQGEAVGGGGPTLTGCILKQIKILLKNAFYCVKFEKKWTAGVAAS